MKKISFILHSYFYYILKIFKEKLKKIFKKIQMYIKTNFNLYTKLSGFFCQETIGSKTHYKCL